MRQPASGALLRARNFSRMFWYSITLSLFLATGPSCRSRRGRIFLLRGQGSPPGCQPGGGLAVATMFMELGPIGRSEPDAPLCGQSNKGRREDVLGADPDMPSRVRPGAVGIPSGSTFLQPRGLQTCPMRGRQRRGRCPSRSHTGRRIEASTFGLMQQHISLFRAPVRLRFDIECDTMDSGTSLNPVNRDSP